MLQSNDRVVEHQPVTDGRTRRAVLFSAAFMALVVTLANHPQIHPKHHSPHGLHASNPQKVKVRLYMESKCPACKEFTSHYLNKIVQANGVRKPLICRRVRVLNEKIVRARCQTLLISSLCHGVMAGS